MVSVYLYKISIFHVSFHLLLKYRKIKTITGIHKPIIELNSPILNFH